MKTYTLTSDQTDEILTVLSEDEFNSFLERDNLYRAFREFLKEDMNGMNAEEIRAIEYGSTYSNAIEALAAYDGKTMEEYINQLTKEG